MAAKRGFNKVILRGKYGLIFTLRNMRLNTGCVMRNNGRISGVILLSAVVYQQAFWSQCLTDMSENL